jgi:hypothetical protein
MVFSVLGWSSPSTRWRPVRAYGVRGGGAQLCFYVRAGSYDTDSLIGALQGLRRFLGGEKATLLWDGCYPTAAPPCADG